MQMSALSDPHDPTVYRVEDDVGEHELQTYILEVLRPLIEGYLREQNIEAHVGSDQFIYWKQHDPQACVAPDIYVLPGVSQSIAIDVWKIWERGVVPSFALEVVGRDPHKDYEVSPRRYAELGVEELVVFDPFDGPGRVAFAVYRKQDGALTRAQATNDEVVFSEQLRCHIRRIGRREETRLRIATGTRGETLVPTAREAVAIEREAVANEREAKEQALRRVAELEAKLAERD